jgi:S-DNA-T family DNA segregation ATPase FtsK/SpoIIIE
VVVALHDIERLARLLHRLQRPRSDDARRVVVVDGLDTVRRMLDGPDTIELFDALDELLAAGGDTMLVGTTRPGALPAALTARCAHRWVLHLHDAHDAVVMGVAAPLVPPPVAGRVHVAATALTAQLVEPSVLLHAVEAPGEATVARLAAIDVVPSVVPAATLPTGVRRDGELVLPVGIDVTTGLPQSLVVPEGDHVLVLGGGRCGRSGALTRLTVAWREAHPHGRVVAVLPRRSSFDRTLADTVVRGTADLGGGHGDVDLLDSTIRPLLVVCDDAELVDDADGRLAALASGRADGLTIVAAARADAVRQRYGHWTTHVRHARLGMVAAGGGDSDGDLLGVVLPRRLPVRPRSGLMWIVDHDGHHLVQIGDDRQPTGCDSRLSPR